MIRFIYCFILFTPIWVNSQNLHLETNISKSLSGFGDMVGVLGDVGVKFSTKKRFYIKTSFGIGKATSTTFSESQLKEQINLLILDEWVQNYPFEYIKESFDIGKGHKNPPTNFQIYNNIKIIVGKDFNLSKKISLGVGGGFSRLKVENSYISAQIPSKIINIYGENNGVITVPHVLSFIDYPLNIEIDICYAIKESLKCGLFINVSEGAIRLSSIGLRISTKL